MNQITYKKSCTSCNSSTGVTHMIMWEDTSELFTNGQLIDEEELIKLIVEFHYHNNIQCEKCKTKNLWNFWEIKVNDLCPPSNNQYGVAIEFDSERTVSYHFYEIARIVNNASKRLDLRLSKVLNTEEFKDIAIEVTIMESILLLRTSYEINLIPDETLLQKMLEYFSSYFNIKMDVNDYNRLKSIFGDWESRITVGAIEDTFVLNKEKFHKPAFEVFGFLTGFEVNRNHYEYFLKQYLQTKQILFFYINKIAKREELYLEQSILNYMNMLIPAINKL